MNKIARGVAGLFSRAVQTIIVGALAVSLIAVPFAIADYTATQGTGTTFASIVISLKHYFTIIVCDATIGETQCQAVNSSGSAQVDWTTSSQAHTDLGAPPNQAYSATWGGCTYSSGNNPACGDAKGAWWQDMGAWAGTALGAPSNYGTSPGAVEVPGVNAFITNAPVLGAGSAIIGNVRIDQTTPGTTNGVQVNAALPAGTNTVGNVGQNSQYPVGSTAVTASATGTTGATTATLPQVASNYNFVCGYSIRANAAAATTVSDTLTGIISGTMTHELWVAPNASGIGVDEQIFNPCIPSSAVNTAISAVSGAPGTSGLVSSTIWGYYKTTSP